MKKLLQIGAAALLLATSASSSAWWGSGNNWPVWTPMYWAEEMFDDNDGYGPYNYGGYGYRPYNGGYRNFPGGWGW